MPMELKSIIGMGRSFIDYRDISAWGPSLPYLSYVKRELSGAGFRCEEAEVAYEVQKGATRMLRVRRQKTWSSGNIY